MRLGQGGRGRQRQAGGSTREDVRKRGHGSTVNTLVVVVKNFTIISAAPLLADVELSSQRDRSGDASVKMLVACGSVVVLGDEGFRCKHPEEQLSKWSQREFHFRFFWHFLRFPTTSSFTIHMVQSPAKTKMWERMRKRDKNKIRKDIRHQINPRSSPGVSTSASSRPCVPKGLASQVAVLATCSGCQLVTGRDTWMRKHASAWFASQRSSPVSAVRFRTGWPCQRRARYPACRRWRRRPSRRATRPGPGS